ncbi:MAG: Rha family transcriptional regulator [Pseudomonadota bacterium]|nr:Rha family transcriptional regulator [Pseudomonadota bacterium]
MNTAKLHHAYKQIKPDGRGQALDSNGEQMNMQILPQHKDLVKVSQRNDSKEVTTTSLKVAEFFKKQHKNVLRVIENLECSEEFAKRNFELCFKINVLQNGKPQPYYKMTKDGFTFVAMGFTGKEAAKFKEDYINAFNEMHDFLNSEQLNLISQFNKALLEFENASDIASQAGRTLSLFGRKIKPLAAEKVAQLESQLQPQLFEVQS